MLREISSQVIVWKAIAGVLGVLLPVVVLLIWMKKKKVGILPAVIGAIIFIVFTQIFEGIPKVIFFSGTTELSQYVWAHTWAYVLIGCLQAGIFEEIGRFVAFRFFLKKYKDRKDAITYGIGHGGIESILILGIGSISSIAMVAAVNSGAIQQTIAVLSEAQQKSVEMQIAALAEFGCLGMLLSVLERVIAMTLHIALSVVVFKSVQEKKLVYLFIAIALHAIFDVPAALYQCGVLSIEITEALLFVAALACAWFARKLYVGMGEKEV